MNPNTSITVLVNPIAGRGRSADVRGDLAAALRGAGYSAEVLASDHPRHMIKLATEATQRDLFIVVGGDGTLNEVVQGLAESTPDTELLPPILLLASGSGNDFSATHGTAKDLPEVLSTLRRHRTVNLDLGMARIDKSAKTVFFANSLGLGLEASAVKEAEGFQRLRGRTLYLAGLLKALRRNIDYELTVSWTRPDGNVETWTGESNVVTFGNGPRSGGGFRLTPDAKADDGCLNIGILRAVSRWRMIPLMVALLRGTHGSHRAVRLDECVLASIECSLGLPVHADGEVVHECSQDVSIAIQPGRLRLLVKDRVG